MHHSELTPKTLNTTQILNYLKEFYGINLHQLRVLQFEELFTKNPKVTVDPLKLTSLCIQYIEFPDKHFLSELLDLLNIPNYLKEDAHASIAH